MSKPTTQRPPQVTFAAGLAIASSVFVVLENFSAVGSLRSLAMREAVESMVSEPPLDQFGLTVEQGLNVSYWSLVVGAVCAVAVAILAWFALQRSTQARVAMTVLAVPLFLSGLFNGGFLTALVAASVTFLWMPPGREWFRDGVWTPPAPPAPREDERPRHEGPGVYGPPVGRGEQPPGSEQAPGARPVAPPHGDGSTAPAHPGWLAPPAAGDGGAQPGGQPGGQPQGSHHGPQQGVGAPQGSPYAHGPGQPYTLAPAPGTGHQPGPTGQPAPQQPYPYPPHGYVPRAKLPLLPRPPQLLSVVVLTVVGGLAAVVAYVLQARSTDAEEMLAQWRDLAPGLFDDYTPEMVETSLWLSVAMIGLWALAAVGLAVCLLWRQQWARILLMISAALVAPYGIVAGIAGSAFMLVAGLCAAAALLMLRSPAVTEWFKP